MPLPFVIVPRRDVNTLCTVADGRLVEINPVPVPLLAEYAISDGGWIAWPEDGGTVGRGHCDAEPHEQRFAPARMPAGYTAAALAFRGPVLYAGGSGGREVLGRFDFNEPAPAWTPLPVPEQFRQEGKSIDDLLVDGDRLIAVDNVVVPKWLLLYDVTNPSRPALADVRELPWHTSWEQIHTGSLGADWMALLSSGANHGTRSRHIEFYGRGSLEPFGGMTEAYGGANLEVFGGVTVSLDFRGWQDLAWVGNVLLIATGRHGLGVLDLDRIEKPPGPRSYDAEYPRYRLEQPHRQFSQACAENLTYHPLPGVPGEVTRLVAVPGTDHVVAVVRAGEAHDSVLLDVPALLGQTG
jgi:hypothetical protein